MEHDHPSPVSGRRAKVRRGDDFGRAIGNLRRACDSTQAELAERAGITRSRLAQIESGISTPLIEHELRLLRLLGAEVTIAWNRP